MPPERPEDLQGPHNVDLTVTVDEQGHVTDAKVEASAGPQADTAALKSVRAWRFAPAKLQGEPVAARVRVRVSFPPKEKDAETAPDAPTPKSSPTQGAPPPATGETSTTDSESEKKSAPAAKTKAVEPELDAAPEGQRKDMHLEVTVHGTRAPRRERRGASDYFLHHEVLSAAPSSEGADVLQTVPGLFLGRSEGLAIAHSLSLRGFDSEHGQDIAISVGGLPINSPSHIHGQGYADLGFLIGDTVDHLMVKEGIRDPRQGDFAVAGSIDVGLGVDPKHRGLSISSSYGSFDTFIQKVVWAPKDGHRESFGAAKYRTTSGFGENRAGQAASGVVQHRFGQGAVTYRAVGFVYAAGGQSAGVLREDDIESGDVCFTCVYDLPTAQAQGAQAQRIMAGLFADYHGPDHASGSLGAWLGQDNFRARSNFSGFLERSRTLVGETGRGDLIEQTNETTSLGLTARYRTEAIEPASWTHGTLEVGLDGRIDTIGQHQNLLDATVRNQVWDRRIQADIRQQHLGIWGDIDWQFGERLSARAGVRAEMVAFGVNDQLGNYAPGSRPDDSFIEGFRRSAMGTVVGPRSSLEFKALEGLSLMASYGEGFRSPQARILEEGDPTPLTRVRSLDGGGRIRIGPALSASLSGYFSEVEEDVAFDAREGTLTRIGPSSRVGAAAYLVSRLGDSFLASLSATYVRATLLDAPPATAEDPAPPFVPGAPLPYLAPLTIRLDMSSQRALFQAGPHPLVLELKTGFTYLSQRPLPYGTFSDPVGLWDASTTFLWGPLSLELAGFNLLDISYANESFVFVSNWDPETPRSRLPSQHIAAGSPASYLLTLGIEL